jgi:uncharacterized membrane protein YsdA (DUF1294 family)/cold shock CspA family protein
MPIKLETSRTAKIVEWNNEKGYGFLQVGKGRVFLHWREFAERHKRPAVGDMIRFAVGVDAQGRTCAKEAVHVNDGGRLTLLAVAALLGLLVLPVFALYRSGVNWRWSGGYAVVITAISYGSYALDKQRARAREWRISEAGLHVTELLGGWPGAFIAQRRLRHKVSKGSYQAVFWAIVLVYQLAAYDALQGWHWSKTVWNKIEARTLHPR